MKLEHKKRWMLFLLTMAVLLPCLASAKIFWRRETRGVDDKLCNLGGTLAYSTDVTINGGKGTMSVFAFNSPLNDIVPLASSAFSARFTRGRGIAMLTVEKEDYTAKLIALETSPMTQCVIFKIEQSRENHRTSREKPALPKSWSLPAFPGSTLEFSARDDDRKSAIAVYTAKNTAEAAQSFFEKTLVSDGWACLHPSSASSSLRMYSKRENICCVSTTDLKGNMSSVLLLHKEDGAQP